MKLLACALLALSACATAGETPEKFTSQYVPPTNNGACAAGQFWTCTIACDPGTRDAWSRLIGGPGVEVCAVSNCGCVQAPPWYKPIPPGTNSVQDLGEMQAIVVFGYERLIK